MGLLSRAGQAIGRAMGQPARDPAMAAIAMLKQLGRPIDINDLQDVEAVVGKLGPESMQRINQMIEAGELQLAQQGPSVGGGQMSPMGPADASPYAPRNPMSPYVR